MGRIASTYTVPQKGIGKPDYSKEVSAGRERAGLTLAYNQTLKIFGIVFTGIHTGAHTAAVHATIMTDAAAHFTVNALVLLTIFNVTDGSSGIIIANTETTVTVAALTDGASNQWNPGDVYTIPSPFAWVQPPLAPGATAHYIDNVTGLAMPFTVPQGYTGSLIAAGGGFTEDAIGWVYFDDYLVMSGGVMLGGRSDYENRVVGISTATVDPTGATSHILDIQVTNIGAGNLEGGISWTGIVEAVGTKPLPTTKTVRCKFCGHEETVPQEMTKWICPTCGQLNIYYNLSEFRRTV
ncbi:hypothetical protein ES707_01102 [subsurface metagenome]